MAMHGNRCARAMEVDDQGSVCRWQGLECFSARAPRALQSVGQAIVTGDNQHGACCRLPVSADKTYDPAAYRRQSMVSGKSWSHRSQRGLVSQPGRTGGQAGLEERRECRWLLAKPVPSQRRPSRQSPTIACADVRASACLGQLQRMRGTPAGWDHFDRAKAPARGHQDPPQSSLRQAPSRKTMRFGRFGPAWA